MRTQKFREGQVTGKRTGLKSPRNEAGGTSSPYFWALKKGQCGRRKAERGTGGMGMELREGIDDELWHWQKATWRGRSRKFNLHARREKPNTPGELKGKDKRRKKWEGTHTSLGF